MGIFTPRITRPRLLGASVLLLVAVLAAYFAGVDMGAFTTGLLLGLIIVGAVAAIMMYTGRRGSDR